MALIAAELAAIEDSDDRRSARVSFKEETLFFRRQGRKFVTGSRLADAVAKFGGGSLFTATLLLIIGGKTGTAIVVTAALGLMLFLVGTAFWIYCDLQASRCEFEAEWLEAVLKETEH